MFDWKKFFNIRIDSAPADELRDRIESDSTVTGANLVILIAAILIACVGLNMDSTAVIIGAMLISPLMGGLVAVSYGMATYNLHFLKKSMVKLSFQIVFSLLTAAIYFALTPITIPTAEMAARTSPTIWDVLIALCGGIAGAVGNTRTVKTNVIPGVAIATALMPPLCTAGYGIAMRSVPYFTGALYLFFINAFFITLSGYFIFKLLDVPMSETISPAHFRFQRHILLLLGIVITIPSIYMAGTTVRESIRTSQIESFINQDMDLHAANVISYQLKTARFLWTCSVPDLTRKQWKTCKRSSMITEACPKSASKLFKALLPLSIRNRSRISSAAASSRLRHRPEENHTRNLRRNTTDPITGRRVPFPF